MDVQTRQKPLQSSVPCLRTSQLLLCFSIFGINAQLVQGFDLVTLVAYPQCTVYVFDLDIKCNTLMLNLNTAEYLRAGGRCSLLSAVGLLMRRPKETFLFGLLGQQSSSDLSLRQLKVDVPLLTTLESDFTYSTVSTSALKELNLFARSSCQLFSSQVFSQ